MPSHQFTGPSKTQVVVALGEVLWDLLPTGPRLGGASANFCATVGRLGNHAVLASRVGADDDGDRLSGLLRGLPIDVRCVQIDPDRPTGTVTVEVDSRGEPQYRINEGVAWDAMELSSSWKELASRADAVCFGTLAQRNPLSRAAIQSFIAALPPGALRVFDINLRQKYFSEDVIRWSLNHSSILKLNEDELLSVFQLLSLPVLSKKDPFRGALDILLSMFPLQMVCLTLGSNGSLVVTRDDHFRQPGIQTTVSDTVGAGDAFIATITHYALRNASLRDMSEAANRNAAWVASQPAAIPHLWPAHSADGPVVMEA
jgi:fructokinase